MGKSNRVNRRKSHWLSENRRKYLIMEERKASREYYSAGLRNFGRDEARHARLLRRMGR